MSDNMFKTGGTWLKESYHASATPTYTVAESSVVRVIFQLNNRKIFSGSDICSVRTQMTIYPTGQMFRWDSVFGISATNIDTVRYNFFEKYVGGGGGAVYTSLAGMRGGLYGATALQDFACAFLTRRNSAGVVNSSIDSVGAHVENSNPPSRIGVRFVDVSPWSKATMPHQITDYFDMQQAAFSTALIDSVCKGVQKSCENHKLRIGENGAGSVDSMSAGDLDTNAFNEREGAYIYKADNANTAHFTLYAKNDTCRFNPAFRIENYTSVSIPQYVYVNNVPKVKDYGFNAYVKASTNELILQLWQKLCSDADIYISSDRTLAVTMTDFIAKSGDAAVSLQWNTQSEENNLGFFLFRRIRSSFLDSIARAGDSLEIALDADEPMTASMLFKSKIIKAADTSWKQVNGRIIYGAMAGVSYGKRSYSWIDKQVYNDVQYEYKLTAVDFNNNTDVYDKYAVVRPGKLLPVRYELRSNYPNPFRHWTFIKFDLPIKTKVMLNVYNIQGKLMKHIIRPDKPMIAGFYRVSWDGKTDDGLPLAAGPYIYRITAQGYAKTKIMILIR